MNPVFIDKNFINKKNTVMGSFPTLITVNYFFPLLLKVEIDCVAIIC